MELVEKPAAPVAAAATADVLKGRVDAVDGVHVFGWAWRPDAPTERLTIEAVLDGRVVAKVTADLARVDLRRNGIGDGSYAFNLELPKLIEKMVHRVEIRAVATDGAKIVLRIPTSDERAVEAAVAAPMMRVIERLDLLIAAQRQLQVGHHRSSEAMTERLDKLCAEGGLLETAVADVSRSQTDVVDRTAAIEIFLARFDETLAGFDKRLEKLQTAAGQDNRAMTVMLATMGGFVLGTAVMLLVLN